MGDENSLAGRTQAHKHESASSTGGYLAEGLTGITGGNVGEVLTATATDIPQWASAGGATVTTVSDTLGASFNSSSNTYVDITNWTLTKPTITGGKCISVAHCTGELRSDNAMCLAIEDNGAVTSEVETGFSTTVTDVVGVITLSDISDTNGNIIQMQGKIKGGTTFYIIVNAGNTVPKIDCFGVG